jgi:hypothetical protein
MAIKDGILAEYDHEMGTTRKLLERVPDDKLAWQPHAKSMSLAGLATHLSNLPNWGATILNDLSFDLAEAPPCLQPKASRAEILDAFRRGSEADAGRARQERRRAAGAVVAQARRPRGVHDCRAFAAFRTFVLYHVVHHRGPAQRLSSAERRADAGHLRSTADEG